MIHDELHLYEHSEHSLITGCFNPSLTIERDPMFKVTDSVRLARQVLLGYTVIIDASLPPNTIRLETAKKRITISSTGG